MESEGATRPSSMRIESTGIAGLDTILGGGIPRGSLVLLAGPPGSGKTTLAAQLAFAAATAGRQVLLLTALSEPSDKLLAHAQTFAFFEEDVVTERLQVLSLAGLLSEGLLVGVEHLLNEVRRRHADLLVLDGFRSIRLAATAPLEAREFLYALGGGLGVQGISSVITIEADPQDTSTFAEATGADVLLSLSFPLQGVRKQRSIEPIKVRGAAPLIGLHPLVIDRSGIAIYPRLEMQVILDAHSGSVPALDGSRSSTGIAALDVVLGGGLTRGTATLVVGSPGTGKTLLGLHFALAGVAAGESTVFLGFHEDASELSLKAETFALGDAWETALAPEGKLTLLRQLSIERDPDLLAHALLDAVDRTGARRLVIDGLAELERIVIETSGRARLPNYLVALTEALRRRRISVLLLKDQGNMRAVTANLSDDAVAMAAATVLWFQQETYRDRLYRVLSVPKMRYSAHDVTLRAFGIEAPAGIVLRDAFEGESGMLTRILQRTEPGSYIQE